MERFFACTVLLNEIKVLSLILQARKLTSSHPKMAPLPIFWDYLTRERGTVHGSFVTCSEVIEPQKFLSS